MGSQRVKTQQSDFHFHLSRLKTPYLGGEDPLEKAVATHSSILAWKVPWTERLVGYSLQGRKESETTEATETALAL